MAIQALLSYQFNDKGNVVSVRDELGYAQFAKYESGHENTPSAISKLQKAVVNRIAKPDFTDTGTNGSWELTAEVMSMILRKNS